MYRGQTKENITFITRAHLFEVGRRLDLSDRLHEGVSDDDTDIRPRVAFCLFPQSNKVGFGEAVWGGAQVKLEHEGPGMLLGQRNVDPLLKSAGLDRFDMGYREHRRTAAWF